MKAPLALVVVGASAGGIGALKRIFAELRRPLGVPVVVVQHLRAGVVYDFHSMLGSPAFPVREVEDKMSLEPGVVYVAPPGYHVLVELDGTLALSVDEPVKFARPSIDVLFETAAEAFGKGLVGVVMTGANDDGANGLSAIKRCGGTAVVQDPKEAEVDVMPLAAMRAAAPDHVLGATEIGRLIAALDEGRRKS